MIAFLDWDSIWIRFDGFYFYQPFVAEAKFLLGCSGCHINSINPWCFMNPGWLPSPMKSKSQVAASWNDMAFCTQPKVTRFHCVRWKSYVPHWGVCVCVGVVVSRIGWRIFKSPIKPLSSLTFVGQEPMVMISYKKSWEIISASWSLAFGAQQKGEKTDGNYISII